MGLASWIAASLMYVVATALSFMVRDAAGPTAARLFTTWDRWDTGHYLRIAEFGYTADRPDTHAFFPLYPLLIRAVDTITPGGPLVAAIVVSHLALIAALIVLHRLTAMEFDTPTADRALLYLLAWPAAFFLASGYNTSLFLLLSTATFYLLRRGSWWLAGVAGAMASATRLSGLLLVVPFVLEYLRQRGWRPTAIRWDAAAIFVIPAGVGAFAAYCWRAFGDPLAFSHAQAEWGRQLQPPWVGLARAVNKVWRHPLLEPVAVHNLIDVVTVVVVLGLLTLSVVGPWRLRRDQVSYLGFAIVALLVVLTGPVGGLFAMQGMPRYALEFTAIFFVLARMGADARWERIYLLPAIGAQVLFLATFLNAVWIA